VKLAAHKGLLLFLIISGVAAAAKSAAPRSIPDPIALSAPPFETGSPGAQTVPGIDGPVNALTTFGGLLIAGGLFTAAGDVLASNIAAWDGLAWAPIGSGVNGRVRALIVFNDQLIAGGDFTTAGGLPAPNIAAWDGSSWSAVGGGIGATVYALAVYDNKLFAGRGDAASIEVWDGVGWAPVGSGTDGLVYALTVHDGTLIAAGRFETMNGVPAHNIAAWDGSAWSSVGFPNEGYMGERVEALTVYDGLLVAGQNHDEDFGSYGQVYTWDGSDWSCLLWYCLGTYKGFSAVYALEAYGDKLVVGGAVGSLNTPFATRIAAWDGSSWSYVGSGTNGTVSALTVFGGTLIAGGSFTAAGDLTAYRVAAWDGASWTGLPGGPRVNYWYAIGAGLGGRVNALTVFNNQIVAGGSLAGSVFIRDGSHWSQLGVLSSEVLALMEWNDELYAGGTFWGGVARWDGAAWQQLGSGIDGTVHSLTVFNNQLIAGGKFTTAGGTPASCIAAWNGVAWSPLGVGVGGPTNAVVEALTVYNGNLVAAGSFTTMGGAAAKYVAAWNGSSWSALAFPGSYPCLAATVLDNKLVVGGYEGDIRSWDGYGWSSMGKVYEFPPDMEYNTGGIVYSLTAWDGTVIAGGYFLTAGSKACNRIAKWTGSTHWDPLWTGMNNTVNALTRFGQRLIAGGDFTTAGGSRASYVACWNPYGEVPVFITMFDASAADGGVDLAWDIVADEDVLGYKIYRSLDGVPSSDEVITHGLLAPNMRSYRDDTALGGRRYEYTLSVVLGDGSEVQSQKVAVNTSAYALVLEQNHPNPFNPSTTISFTLPERTRVKLAVYDVQGKLVRTLVDAMLSEGRQERTWDGRDTSGKPVASGVYFYRLETTDRTLTRKMLLLK
jgi:trimeric autotransporter adhesin